MIAVSAWQVNVGGQVKVIAWYDMNNDGVINYKDFDLNNDGAVTWIDVQTVINAKNATYTQRYDFNRDGVVDDKDVEIIKAWMGNGKMCLYDMNGDGVVDWRDLDVNNDGHVDMRDIVLVAKAYGSKIGDAAYNPRVDFNQDGIINDDDYNLIKPYFGYPLSLIDLFNLSLPTSQMFIFGLATTVLGVAIFFHREKR